MRPPPIVAARIDFSGTVPRSLDAGDLYHARAGAAEQARHVFLNGNGLPARWQGRRHFTLLETGFGLGQNFLATWQAWRDDPQHCRRLDYVALELHPPVREDLQRALAACPWPDLAGALVALWPALLPGVHTLHFEEGRVRLHLVLGDARHTAPSLSGEVDAFYLDGFAPRLDPGPWEPAVLRALGRRAAPGATLATWSVARGVRSALQEAGFEVGDAPGLAGRTRMTVARHPGPIGRSGPASAAAPNRGRSRPPPGRPAAAWDGEHRAVIVGGGLAGAAVAAHLAAEGWHCTVLDHAGSPAAGASGNPAGLFHGALHQEDGLHARLHRAGALRAAHSVELAIQRGGVAGSVEGLRVRLSPDAGTPAPCPPEYAYPIPETLGRPEPGWIHYSRGGWVDPAAMVRWWLAGPGIEWRGRCQVAGLRRACASKPDDTAGWELLDGKGAVLEQAPVVVLALGSGLAAWPGSPWPITPVRGQVTWFASEEGLTWPVSGDGYAVRLPSPQVLCGATSTFEDPESALRETDHTHNLQRLERLTGIRPAPGAALGGRVGWRAVTPDRLPLIGAVPRLQGLSPADQVRFVPREPGLFVVGGYGSRGLTWATLGGEIITAWLEGTPVPLEGDLLDAVDPARFTVRAWRRAARDAA